MKTRIHTVAVKIRFDKKCTAKFAKQAVRDCMSCTMYPTAFEDHEPGEFKLVAVKSAAKAKYGAA